mmetsp:Transcript_13345/g.23885  ORF Transcript_13345/g.23885 Transcript_13345/m.23885 type:complete len:235 (-) Transcript_13345:67-771(-)
MDERVVGIGAALVVGARHADTHAAAVGVVRVVSPKLVQLELGLHGRPGGHQGLYCLQDFWPPRWGPHVRQAQQALHHDPRPPGERRLGHQPQALALRDGPHLPVHVFLTARQGAPRPMPLPRAGLPVGRPAPLRAVHALVAGPAGGARPVAGRRVAEGAGPDYSGGRREKRCGHRGGRRRRRAGCYGGRRGGLGAGLRREGRQEGIEVLLDGRPLGSIGLGALLLLRRHVGEKK